MISKHSQTLICCLGLALISFYATPGMADSADRIAADVARLKALIKNHHELMNSSEHSSSKATGVFNDTPGSAVNIDNIDWSKVVFSESESIYVVQRIGQSIAEASIDYRQVDKVLHIKGSRDGNLLYNRTTSLKGKGNAQYLGRAKLSGGNNSISIDGKTWQFSLESDVEIEYIVAYSLAGNKICIFPLKGILNSAALPLPAWLPLTDAERSSVKPG